MSDCHHGFGDWTNRTTERILARTGCPSCLVEAIADIEAAVAMSVVHEVPILEDLANAVEHAVLIAGLDRVEGE